MRSYYLITLLSTLLVLASCQSEKKGAKDKVVTINTGGIYEPLTVEMDTDPFMGYFLVGQGAKVVTFRFVNNSRYDATNLKFELDDVVNAGMTFVKTPEGGNFYPGVGGTCTNVLGPSKSCLVKIIYEPNLPGDFVQKIKISYNNLIDQVNLEQNLSVLAGDPASLVFTNDVTTYNLGIQERTFSEDIIVQDLEVENRGGLPAFNLNVSIENVPNSGAYRIAQNNCPEMLGVLEKCQLRIEFSSQNYDATAPDGDTDRLNYATTVKFEYEKDPFGSIGNLNARLNILSTTIEARMERGGLADIKFSDIVVGNTQSRQFRFLNSGFKEAILRAIHINNGAVRVATCVNVDGSGLLECRDPADINNPAAKLALSTLPFRFYDTNICLTELEKLSYTRNPDGTLSESGIRTVAGNTVDTNGETCIFRAEYHPSVEFLTDGDWSGLTIHLEYDSTWKNGVVLFGDQPEDDWGFIVAEAPYRAAAVLTNNRLRLDDEELPGTVPFDSTYFYDLGRLTLISSAAYRSIIDFNLVNSGGDEAEIVSIVDGKGKTVTMANQMFDNYYRNVNHDACNTLMRNNIGSCNVRIQLTPLASTNPDGTLAENEENGAMFDLIDGPTRLKRFFITYKDGATLNDDLTPRADRQIEVRFSALLVRKGFLVYDELNDPSGNIGDIVSGNEKEFTFAVRNVGTGAIPYLSFLPGLDLNGTTRKNADREYPFEIIAKDAASVNADTPFDVDHDCSVIFSNHADGTPAALPEGNNAPGVLGAGQACSFTLRSKLRSTDIQLADEYIENLGAGKIAYNGSEWGRAIFSDNPERSWELVTQTFNTSVDIRYYDGDGISDALNGYNPDLVGYGNLYEIGLPSQSEYALSASFREPASLVPFEPFPMSSAIFYRPEFTLPFLPADSWGSSRDAFVLPAIWDHVNIGETNNFAASAGYSKIYLEGTGSEHLANYPINYTLHVGSFPAGGEYDFSFKIYNSGNTSGNITDMQLSMSSMDPNSIEVLTPLGLLPDGRAGILSAGGTEKEISFKFRPQVANVGVHQGIFSYTYETGVILPGDIAETQTVQVKIVAEALTPSAGQPLITYQNVTVSYDELADPVYSETVVPDVLPVSTAFNTAPVAADRLLFRAVRGGAIYVKKLFTVTNPHLEPLRNLRFIIKAGAGATIVQNSNGSATGYKIFNNSCLNVTLNQFDKCTFELWFKASPGEPLETLRNGVLVYHWGTANQYVNTMFNLEFNAVNPAILSVLGVNPTTVLDASNNNIPSSYAIDYGSISSWNSTSHRVLTSFPSVFVGSNINVINSSEQKASFIAEYRKFVANPTADPPAANEWTEIYNERRLKIEANRACFYGDDAFDADIPLEQKGFNMDTVSPCYLRPTYTASDEYLGENIETKDNIHRFTFFDNERSSSNFINFFVKGFIEPNRSLRGAQALPYNLETDATGRLALEWSPMTVINDAWGPIVGYRVYYSDLPARVDNLFTNTAVLSIDSTTTAAEITGLNPLTVYYVRIAALRESPSGKIYVSRDRDWERYHFITPDEDHFYSFASNSLITKRLAPAGQPYFQGTKTEATSYCSGRTLRISRNGSNTNYGLSLIGANQYQAIVADPANTVADRPMSILPHWIGGAPVDIVPIFGPNSEVSLSGSLGLMFYIKGCPSCNALSYIEGGDGEDFPPDSVIFIDGESYSANARCYLPRP